MFTVSKLVLQSITMAAATTTRSSFREKRSNVEKEDQETKGREGVYALLVEGKL